MIGLKSLKSLKSFKIDRIAVIEVITVISIMNGLQASNRNQLRADGSGHFKIWTIKYLDILISEHFNFWTSKYLDIQIFWHLNIWTSKYQNIWISSEYLYICIYPFHSYLTSVWHLELSGQDQPLQPYHYRIYRSLILFILRDP